MEAVVELILKGLCNLSIKFLVFVVLYSTCFNEQKRMSYRKKIRIVKRAIKLFIGVAFRARR